MFTVRFLRFFREVAANKLRTFKQVFKYPDTYISTGVSIGNNCSFGSHVKIYRDCTIGETSVGDHSYIGSGSQLKNCSIGNFCSLGKNVQIGLGMHPVEMISTYPGFYSEAASGCSKFGTNTTVIEHMPVSIGSDVWVGNNCLILDGVEIGNGAVIAAGSVVTKSVPAFAIVAGVPAKTLRMRFDPNRINFLQGFEWWNRSEEFCRENAEKFMNPEAFFDDFDR